MEAARELLHMLVLRKRAAARAMRSTQRSEGEHYYRGKRDEAATAFELARTMYRLSRGGSPQAQEERRRVIAISTQRQEFVTLVDGYVHFWPDGSPHGALTSWHLRTLADELDRRNRSWDARVRKELGSLSQRDDS